MRYAEVDCRAHGIEGLERFHQVAEHVLREKDVGNIICIIRLPESNVLLGQCSFVFEFGQALKFSRNVNHLLELRYFEQIIEIAKVDQLIFTDRTTFDWFHGKLQYADYRSITKLVPKYDAGPPSEETKVGGLIGSASQRLADVLSRIRSVE